MLSFIEIPIELRELEKRQGRLYRIYIYIYINF